MKEKLIGLAAVLSFPFAAGCVGSDVDEFTSMTVDDPELGAAETAMTTLSAQPGLNDIFIEKITASGSGCRTSNSVVPVIGDDRQSFIIIFNDMQLVYPPGTLRQNISCNAVVQLHVPEGIQVSVATVNTRGFAKLDRGHAGQQISRYFFAGQPLGSTFRTPLSGPFEKTYTFSDDVLFGSGIWSPCGESRPFAINTQLFLDTSGNPRGAALFNTDTVDGVFRKILHIQWRPCQ
jgi:hypothetical protein